jgi:signal transduction histidine kinase
MTRRLARSTAATVTSVNQEERGTDVLLEELQHCREQCRDIARDIHDGPFHEMTGLALAMAAAQSASSTPEEYAARCRESQQRLEVSLGDLRRAIHRLERCGRSPAN